MADGYEQDDRDFVSLLNINGSDISAEQIYDQLGCEALEK